jgi:hypothetical protein
MKNDRMTDHKIENFMKLVKEDKTSTEVESTSDQYYRNVYGKITSGKDFVWNWSAFFGGPLWFLYRKMYLFGFLWAALIEKYFSWMGFFSEKLLWFLILLLLPWFVMGLFGNWLYVQHINRKISKGYHFCELKNQDRNTCWLFFFYVLSGLISAELVATHLIASAYFLFSLILGLAGLILGLAIPIFDYRKVKSKLAEKGDGFSKFRDASKIKWWEFPIVILAFVFLGNNEYAKDLVLLMCVTPLRLVINKIETYIK